MINAMAEFFSHFSALNILIVAVNLLLMLLARPLILKTAGKISQRQIDFRVNMLQVLNLAILAAVCYSVIYSGGNIASYVMRRRYGKTNKGNDGVQVSDTYHSRMLTLICSTFIAILALIAIIRIAGFSSMLEAGGAIGFVGVFEGDLIELDESKPLIARVFKTKVFHTVLIDVVNNHRIMVSNSKLRDQTIHSLSKFASAKGLREKLTFKIGYDTSTDAIKTMFNEAFEKIAKDPENNIDDKHSLEVRVLDTGDHAVEWGVFYYLKDVGKLIAVRQGLYEEILEASRRYGISLSTPLTHEVTNKVDDSLVVS